MQEYVIKKIGPEFCEEDWATANVAEVNVNPWKEFTPEFNTTARLLYNDEAVYVRMETDELPIVAKYVKRNDPVCTDSCMEFFFCPSETDGRYFNFEFNALGTLNLSIGESRHDRKFIEDPLSTFDIHPELFDGGWRITFKIPMDFIRKYMGEPTEVMHGNFQKCGSATGHRHYGLWKAIETENPDFHRPEFFGNLKFEK